ncbi:hypothetical protein GVAMD_1130 [Gardnerella vaginalis AMD]|nr:hypothetical protein GVAMD_1130 [Gardnerella vaginalis AMD]
MPSKPIAIIIDIVAKSLEDANMLLAEILAVKHSINAIIV